MIELDELREAVRKAFPAANLAPQRDESWKLASDLGWLLLPVPEELGGLALGRSGSIAVLYELGAVLGTAPLLPALPILATLGSANCASNLAGIIDQSFAGQYIATDLGARALQCEGNRLHGILSAVPDADIAGHILVALPDMLALVPSTLVSARERQTWDQTRRLFEISVDGVSLDDVQVVATGIEATSLEARLKAELLFALAADSLGGANAALELTVAYLKTRFQYERPLAMFQALKHRCADLKAQIAAAEALLWSATGRADVSVQYVGGLKAHCTDVYCCVVEEATQLHGGIALTDEYSSHLFLKRAFLNRNLGGSSDQWFSTVGSAALPDEPLA